MSGHKPFQYRWYHFPGVLVLRIFGAFVLALGYVDEFVNWIFFRIFPRQYVRRGSCQQCGLCCERLVIELSPKFILRFKVITWFLIRWHEIVNNFTFLGVEYDVGYLFFKCNHVTKEGKCGIHWRRYPMCRTYPKEQWFGKRTLLPWCGYRFVLRKSRRSFEEIAKEEKEKVMISG
ncbi:YkgJ family cysteine cluster protein [Candidatus Margulisiibacteriota bacterium]